MTKNEENLDQTGTGITVFGSYNFSKELAVVGRYDYYDSNTDANVKGDSRNENNTFIKIC
ncbi:hypothetical protein BMS3Abin04_01464 [bacterium BMS3Abin04]|nr:hypothetical protein BMS3Abin04_01464 [bacterium BMS3Abin04]